MEQYAYHQPPVSYSSQTWTPEPSFHSSAGNGQVSPIIIAQEKARKKGVVWRALLVGALVLLFLFGMIIILGSYICLAHKCVTSSGGQLISTAPLGKVLTISQIASHISPVTVPFVMGLCAYQVGAEWLQNSAKADRNRPSPLQLGLLMSICNAANFGAAFDSLKYLLGSNKGQYRKLPTPPLLRRSLIILIALLILSYVASGADAWFHATSTAISIPFTSPYSGTQDFGREINSTMCGTDWTSLGPPALATCGQLNDGSQSGLLSRPEGLRTISNSSSINRVAFTQDQTAIIIPASVPPNITYTAETIGLRTTCAGITQECLVPTNVGGVIQYGSDAALNLQCRGPTIFNVTVPGTLPEGSLDPQGNIVTGFNISTNPFHVGAVVSSFAYQGTQDTFLRNDSGWFIHGSAGAYNVVYCNVTVLDIFYTYSAASNQYIVRQADPFPVKDAQHIIALGYDGGTRIISTFVEGIGVSTKETYEQAYALELSRQVTGLGAYLYQPKSVLGVQNEYEVLGSSLNLLPLAFLVSAMLIYGLTVIIILIRIVISVASVPYTRLASLYLTDPLTTVNALYSPPNPVSTWRHDTIKRFIHQNEDDRLYIGPVGTGIPGESTFGVVRGVAGK